MTIRVSISCSEENLSMSMSPLPDFDRVRVVYLDAGDGYLLIPDKNTGYKLTTDKRDPQRCSMTIEKRLIGNHIPPVHDRYVWEHVTDFTRALLFKEADAVTKRKRPHYTKREPALNTPSTPRKPRLVPLPSSPLLPPDTEEYDDLNEAFADLAAALGKEPPLTMPISDMLRKHLPALDELIGKPVVMKVKGIRDIKFNLITDKGHSTDTIPMILTCPSCNTRHIDEGEFERVPHHTHACQSCGMVWRPARVNTHGVKFLPGYKGE